MILKDADDRAHDIAELKRLKEVSPTKFHASIQKQIDSIYSGLSGERNAAHFLNREFGASERVAILHDLRIGYQGDFAQIDHLLIHRIQGTAWLLETKNYSGRISCDEHGDWTVWYNNKPRPIASPSNQARRHAETLRLWLAAAGVKGIHRIVPVVLISPTSSVNRKKIPNDIHIVKSDNFGDWWGKQADALGIGSTLAIMGKFALNGLSRDHMIVLGKHLANAHVPPVYDWRSMLKLPKEEKISKPPRHKSKTDGDLLPTAEPLQTSTEGVQIISTPHGEVKISRIPDGRYAIRNDKNDALIDIVRKAVKGRGQWNPRFKNWLVAEEHLPAIVASFTV